MPFTLSHPAAIIPIKKKWSRYFSLTALILGSMAPDFEYFLRFRPMGIVGHTFWGFLYLNLPLCLLLAYLFHYVIKKPLVMCLPHPMDNWYRYLIEKRWEIKSLKEFLIFVYSALLGMFTHVFWDGFTHSTGMFVRIIPSLSNNINFYRYSIPVYKLLQHGSTLLGLIVILIFLFKIRNRNVMYSNKMPSSIKIIYFAVIFLMLISLVLYKMNGIEGVSKGNIGIFVVTVVDGLFIGIMTASAIVCSATGK
ncbi:hypothetical protein CLTEP_16240 [Clostridium tepidiprofundi DSM 19306]|uniref:DUF4184 family protein n=1 Tax=Clostridium tepidiprofundi DSM 19306 TaxID=1121338 RepID=A0A151B3A4_9CLOT|nr:DUF4184 family protein [Clostridium tepidiprofundi]KYH34391.1 hypothetical protein CLTEP_16240 [Clostridium tepidiprofundi DSM 19306]